MRLRRLTDEGTACFRAYLHQLLLQKTLPPPVELLTDSEASHALPTDSEVEQREFPTRLAAAEYLDSVLSTSGLAFVEREAGLWSWLALFYFDQLCPPGQGGARKPSTTDFRYIAAVNNFQKYYRHLLLGPYVIYRAHSSNVNYALAVLLSPLNVFNDLTEQLASRKEWITNSAVVGAATRLYVSTDGQQFKRGALGKGFGSPRRLSKILDQFDLTYDLYGMTPDDVLDLLPKEFDRFRN